MSPVKVEDYDSIVNAINRKYTKELVHRGNDLVRLPSISTGSPEMDVAMGGGVPQGRWTRFFGGYGSTKTLTAYAVIAQAQKMGLMAAYYNIERRYEETLAQRLGINTDELTLVEGTTIEEITEKMESLLGVVHLHVLDSTSMADSEDALAADIRDWRPGILARVWGKAFKRLNERFDQTENTAIIIQQMRQQKKGGGRNAEWIEDAEGGRVFDHVSSMSVLFRTGSWLWRAEQGGFSDGGDKSPKLETSKTDSVDKQMVPQGREIKIRVEKSSVCRPFRTATLHYDLDTLEYDRVGEYSRAGIYYGIIRQNGAFYTYADADGEATKLHGIKQVRKFVEENPSIQEYIREVALDANAEDNR